MDVFHHYFTNKTPQKSYGFENSNKHSQNQKNAAEI